MSSLHGREKRSPANQPEPERTVDWPAVIQLDETRGVLMSSKGNAERREFLEWLETDLSRVSGRILTQENVAFFLEFLPYALEDTKRSDVVLHACKCSLMTYLWLLDDVVSDDLRTSLWEPLHKILRQSHPFSTRLGALKTLFCMAALSYQPSAKEIADLLEKVVLPAVETAAKVFLDGTETPAEESDDNTTYLCGLIKLLGCSLGFLEKQKLNQMLDWCFDSLVILLEQHETLSVKVASAEAAVAALDLIQRNEELDWSKINPRDLMSALHGVLRDEDWGTDEERYQWKRTVEELVSMVDAQDYVVELPFITTKGHSFVMSKDTLRADKSVLFKHRNKKGKAVAGWSDAICVSFIRDTLGYTFSELSHVGDSETKVADDLRTQDGFSNCFLSLLARHPAAESFAEHVRNLRRFGSTSRITGPSKNPFHRSGTKRDMVRDELS